MQQLGGLRILGMELRGAGAAHQSNYPTIHQSNLFGLAPEVGIAPTSPPLQGGANLSQLLGAAGKTPKAEIRNPKEVRSPKCQEASLHALLLDFGIRASFGFRFSDFRFSNGRPGR